MHAKSGSRIILVALLGLVASPHESRADFAQCTNPLSACTATSSSCCIASFAAASGKNPILIPMDRCHQTLAGSSSVNGFPGSLAPRRQLTISSFSRSGTTVTVTTSAAHGLTTNSQTESLKITETGQSSLNGTFVVKTGNKCSPTCTTTTFQYTSSTSGTLSGTGGKVLAYSGDSAPTMP